MNRKELLKSYKETPRPAGVYRVQHVPSGRTLLGSSRDAPAMLNRIQAQLRMRAHPNRALQADWDSDGSEAFVFDVVDLLPPSSTPDYDPSADLVMLEELWREKLELRSEHVY